MKQIDWCAFFCMILILFMGCFVRFQGLSGQGMIFYDAGNMGLEGKLLHASFTDANKTRAMLSHGVTLWTARPGFAELLALAFHLGGTANVTVLALNGFLGVVSILLIMWFLYELGEPRLGLFAASSLAVMEWHVFYSRTGMAEIAPSMFVILGFLLYVTGARNRALLFLAGISMGTAFTCNYRVVFMPLALILMPFIMVKHNETGKPGKWQCALFLAMGMALPFLMQELFALLYLVPKNLQEHSYFSRMIESLTATAPDNRPDYARSHFTVQNSTFYLRFFLMMEGWWTVIFFLLGFLYLFMKKKRIFAVSTIPVILPVILFSFYAISPLPTSLNNRFPRSLSCCLPFFSILTGAGLYLMAVVVEKALKVTDRSGINMVTIAVLAAHLVYGYTNVQSLIKLHAGYSEAVEYVHERSNGKYFSTNAPVAWFNDGLGYVNFPPYTTGDMREVSKEEQVSYLLVDYIYHRLPYPSVEDLKKSCDAEKSVSNPLALYMPVLLETYLNFEYSEQLMKDPDTGKILIFNIPSCR